MFFFSNEEFESLFFHDYERHLLPSGTKFFSNQKKLSKFKWMVVVCVCGWTKIYEKKFSFPKNKIFPKQKIILSYHNHNNNNDQHRMTWKLEIFIGKIYFIHFSKCKTNIVLQGNICNVVVVVVDIILVYVIDYHQYCCYRFSCCCCCCCLKKKRASDEILIGNISWKNVFFFNVCFSLFCILFLSLKFCCCCRCNVMAKRIDIRICRML